MYPRCWESPGGKVEPGELPVEALERELREEIAWEGHIIPATYFETRFQAGDFGLPSDVRIVYYIAIPEIGWRPKLIDVDGVGWFTTEQQMALPLIPGNQRLLQHIVRQREGSARRYDPEMKS